MRNASFSGLLHANSWACAPVYTNVHTARTHTHTTAYLTYPLHILKKKAYKPQKTREPVFIVFCCNSAMRHQSEHYQFLVNDCIYSSLMAIMSLYQLEIYVSVSLLHGFPYCSLSLESTQGLTHGRLFMNACRIDGSKGSNKR